MTPYLFRIIKSDKKSWLKFLMCKKAPWSTFSISDLVSGSSLTLNNTIRRELAELNIMGNSIQDGEPSLENPVPVNSVGDNGSASIKKVNKNLFDGANPVYVANKILNDNGLETAGQTGGYTKMYIAVKPNTTYTISGMSEYGSKRIYYFNKLKSFISRTDRFGTTYNTFTTPSDCYYVDFQYFIEGNDFTDYQLEQGSTATPYTPHESKTYIIPIQQPMRSIGEVRDDFVRQNGSWYERHKIGRVLFTGAETENWARNSSDENYYRLVVGLENSASVINSDTQIRCKSNYFVGASATDTIITNPTANLIALISNNRIMVNLIDTTLFGVGTFKTWLSTHNTEVIYELAEPLLLPCTNEQIEVLDEITTDSLYAEQTNFFSNDEVPPYLEVKYWKENA